jgi:hypothetical protein
VGAGKEIDRMVPRGPFDSDGMMGVEIVRLAMAHAVTSSPGTTHYMRCPCVWGVEGVGQGLHCVMTVVSRHWC